MTVALALIVVAATWLPAVPEWIIPDRKARPSKARLVPARAAVVS